MRYWVATLLLSAAWGCHWVFPYRDRPPADGQGKDRAHDLRVDRRVDLRVDRQGDLDARGALCADGFVSCGGNCVAGANCSTCAAPLLCSASRTCVSSCAGCVDLTGKPVPIECFACDLSQKNPIGTCEHNDTASFCLSAVYTTAHGGAAGQHCDCSNSNVSQCPGSQHVCRKALNTDWCITCGEVGLMTDGLPCKGKGTCQATLSPPRCQ